MVEITIEIPEELNKEIKEFNLDVSKAIIESIKDELAKFVALRTLASRSKMTEEAALELGRKLKRGRFQKLKNEGFV